MSLHGLILAAGEGHRFGGQVKQLAVINGQTLLARCLHSVAVVIPNNISVVLGAHHQTLSPLIDGANIIINSNWREGLGSSIACGVSALPSSASAVLIVLCDQVAITSVELTLLRDRYLVLLSTLQHRNLPIVCAAYAGGVGVPAIFSREYFAQLSALKGDVGAKKLMNNNLFVSLPLESAAIDIDTQHDWFEFQSQLTVKKH